MYSPVSGEVVEFNEKLVEEPGTVRCPARTPGCLFRKIVNGCTVVNLQPWEFLSCCVQEQEEEEMLASMKHSATS